MQDRLISTLAMVRDPRLRRLFATCGLALDSESLEPLHHDLMLEVLLDIAPEYVPPDEQEHYEGWREIIAMAEFRTATATYDALTDEE